MVPMQDTISAAELFRHLQAITAAARLSGSPAEARAFDYIGEQLTGFGYAVQRFESEALIGYPVRAALHVLGPRPTTFHANGYALSPGTGELLFVGVGMPDDYATIDARGKIVLSDGLAMPGKARAASLASAIGQIHINRRPDPRNVSLARVGNADAGDRAVAAGCPRRRD